MAYNINISYYEISWAYYMNDQPQQAIAAIEWALELSYTPNSSYYYRAGFLYERNDQIDKARAAYERAAELDPSDKRVKDALQRLVTP